MSAVQFRLWPPSDMLMNKTKLLFAAAVFAVAGAFSAAFAASDEAMVAVMHAMFLSERGGHEKAARALSTLGEALEEPGLLREAYQDSLSARDFAAAVKYARRWRELGGGAPALQAEGRLLFLLGKSEEAAPILAEYKNGGATNEMLFQIFAAGRKEDALPLADEILDDTADGDYFRARLAARFDETERALKAVARGMARADGILLTQLHFARIRIVAGDDSAAAVPLIDGYVADGCPGGGIVCGEADAVHSYSLFAAGREKWRESGEDAAEILFAAGRFFEIAEIDSRARPYYEKVAEEFFHARLGLARIARRAGELENALAWIDDAPVADDGEFALREATATEIVGDLRGTSAGLERIVRAREISPENYDLLYMHSFLAEESGDLAAAIALLEELTELFPHSANGWNALGYVLADHNLRLDDAEEYIKKALSIDSGSANILDSLGWVYYRQGRFADALEYLQKAAALSESAEIFAHLGEVHWQLGDYAKARAAFSKGKQYDAEDEVLNETLRRLQVTD